MSQVVMGRAERCKFGRRLQREQMRGIFQRGSLI
jgi:hypothetical protein